MVSHKNRGSPRKSARSVARTPCLMRCGSTSTQEFCPMRRLSGSRSPTKAGRCKLYHRLEKKGSAARRVPNLPRGGERQRVWKAVRVGRKRSTETRRQTSIMLRRLQTQQFPSRPSLGGDTTGKTTRTTRWSGLPCAGEMQSVLEVRLGREHQISGPRYSSDGPSVESFTDRTYLTCGTSKGGT